MDGQIPGNIFVAGGYGQVTSQGLGEPRVVRGVDGLIG
jgi:hypothetical protein